MVDLEINCEALRGGIAKVVLPMLIRVGRTTFARVGFKLVCVGRTTLAIPPRWASHIIVPELSYRLVDAYIDDVDYGKYLSEKESSFLTTSDISLMRH